MTSDIWTSSFINDLTDEDLQSFQEIVVKDVKNQYCSSDEKSILKNNLDLWLFCLRNIRKEVELKLSHRKINVRADIHQMKIDGVSEYEIDQFYIDSQKSRNGIKKFLTAVERKTLYVKLLIDEEDKS